MGELTRKLIQAIEEVKAQLEQGEREKKTPQKLEQFKSTRERILGRWTGRKAQNDH